MIWPRGRYWCHRLAHATQHRRIDEAAAAAENKDENGSVSKKGVKANKKAVSDGEKDAENVGAFASIVGVADAIEGEEKRRWALQKRRGLLLRAARN